MTQSRTRLFTPANLFIALILAMLVIINLSWLSSSESPSVAEAGQLTEYTFPVATCNGVYPNTPSLVYLPKDYDADATRTWPVVLFLHGTWHRGSDPDLVRQSGIPRLIEDGEHYPFILVAPQCPTEQRWHTEDLALLLDEVENRFRVDPDQIHVTGFQLGGYATWDLAASDPDRFATAVPFGGHRDKEECRGPAPEWMTRLHLWYFYALPDEVTNAADAIRSINTVWNSGTFVRMTDASEGSRDLPTDWTRICQRNELVDWMLGKRRKMRHAIRWVDGSPSPGQLAQGELCESTAGQAGQSLLRFWLYTPSSATAENPKPAPLLLSLHDDQHAGDDASLLLETPVLQAIRHETEPSCFVLSPQRPADAAWDFALLEDLRDQLDVTLAIDPHRQYVTGVGEGATAVWDFAVRNPFNFSAMAPIGFSPRSPYRQQAHRLINLPKHFYSIDQTTAPVVEYCQLISDMTYKKAAPECSVSDDETVESLAERICSSGELFDWFADQPDNTKRAGPRYRPLGVPYHLKMASPEVVDLFERHEYQFETHDQATKPFNYSLHKPAMIEPGRTYPLIIWVHGHGDSERHLEYGELQWMDAVIPDPADSDSHDFFMLAVQCPGDRSWFDRSSGPGLQQTNEPITAVMEIAEKIQAEYPVDRRRVSIVGVSSGSSACWEFLKRHPHYFAAIAPIAGDGVQNSGFADDLSGERIWAFKGLVDGDVDSMRKTIHHVRTLGAEAELTEVLRDAHFVWPEAFFDHQLLDWLLEQRRN